MPFETLVKKFIAATGTGCSDIIVPEPQKLKAFQPPCLWSSVVLEDPQPYCMLKIIPPESRDGLAETFDIFIRFNKTGGNVVNYPNRVLISTAAKKMENFTIIASQRITPNLWADSAATIVLRLEFTMLQKYLMLTFRPLPDCRLVDIALISVHAKRVRPARKELITQNDAQVAVISHRERDLAATPGAGAIVADEDLLKDDQHSVGSPDEALAATPTVPVRNTTMEAAAPGGAVTVDSGEVIATEVGKEGDGEIAKPFVPGPEVAPVVAPTEGFTIPGKVVFPVKGAIIGGKPAKITTIQLVNPPEPNSLLKIESVAKGCCGQSIKPLATCGGVRMAVWGLSVAGPFDPLVATLLYCNPEGQLSGVISFTFTKSLDARCFVSAIRTWNYNRRYSEVGDGQQPACTPVSLLWSHAYNNWSRAAKNSGVEVPSLIHGALTEFVASI